MTEDQAAETAGTSPFFIANALFSEWRHVRNWMIAGSVLALLAVVGRPLEYVASASFVPLNTEVNRSGLASLAGQFGVSLPTPSQSGQSSEFYVGLLNSRVVRTSVVRDTFVLGSERTARVSFLERFGVGAGKAEIREAFAVQRLGPLVTTSAAKTTGVVRIEVKTRWPEVSLRITQRMLEAVNEFNLITRRGQATLERRFVERRLQEAELELRATEDRLQRFLLLNRMSGSPDLAFERSRLERVVQLNQQIFGGLRQSLEDVRIRESRDVPVITVIENPYVSPLPEPRGRGLAIVLGMFLGLVFGILSVVGRSFMASHIRGVDPEADAFLDRLLAGRDFVARFMRSAVSRLPSRRAS